MSLVLFYSDRWHLHIQPPHKFISSVTKQRQEVKVDQCKSISITENINRGTHFACAKNAMLKYEESVVISGPRREGVSVPAPLENNPD